MKQPQSPFRFTYAVLLVPMGLLLAIWTVYLFEVRMGVNLNHWGIYPRTLKGLRGILTSPFIHGSLTHLYHNTLPLVILSAALFYFYRNIAWKTLLYGMLFTGVLTWVLGRPSFHIGASGLIYLLAAFIFFKGIISKHYRLVALSLGVVFLYGGMVWYVLPIEDGISWEGHLAGGISGFLLAVGLRAPIPQPVKYAWEQPDYEETDDPFMRHFDSEGNFIERLEEPNSGEDVPDDTQIQIRYHLRKTKDPDQ